MLYPLSYEGARARGRRDVTNVVTNAVTNLAIAARTRLRGPARADPHISFGRAR
jgi:hypothetical protein